MFGCPDQFEQLVNIVNSHLIHILVSDMRKNMHFKNAVSSSLTLDVVFPIVHFASFFNPSSSNFGKSKFLGSRLGGNLRSFLFLFPFLFAFFDYVFTCSDACS